MFFVFQLRWQSEDGGEETPTTFAPEIHRAAESVRFIAQRIVSKDSYNQVVKSLVRKDSYNQVLCSFSSRALESGIRCLV